MAKILHDHLQQLLVGAKFRLTILGRHSDPVVQQATEEVNQLLDESIKSSRSLTAELSPPILHEGGLVPGLEWLARWMADRHGLIVDLAMEQDIPPLVEDVKVLLFESTRELLFNAVKHARVHAVGVNLRLIEGKLLHITVSDAGPGFDASQLKPAGALGGGFGLFSIRERLHLLGGRLDIDSAPGKGSRFTLIAPISNAVEAPPAAAAARHPGGDGQAAQAAAPLSGMRIRVLLADDHAVMRQGLTSLLRDEPDIEVIGEAVDGLAAVELARELAPDVILMDLSMPKVNGIDATRMIHSARPEIRIIGLSMFQEPQQAQAMLDAGAVAYLTKSGPAESLVSTIRNCAAGETAPAATPPNVQTPDAMPPAPAPPGRTRRKRKR
jgi:DNA-binding NarL/FixJ family response regulator